MYPLADHQPLGLGLDPRQQCRISGLDLVFRQAIDALDAAALTPLGMPVHWLELVRTADSPLPAAALRIAAQWQQQQVALTLQQLSGPPFWNTPDTTTSEALIALTCAAACQTR